MMFLKNVFVCISILFYSHVFANEDICLLRIPTSGGLFDELVPSDSGAHILLPVQFSLTVDSIVNDDDATAAVWFENNGLLEIQSGAFLPFAVDTNANNELPPLCEFNSSSSASALSWSMSQGDTASSHLSTLSLTEGDSSFDQKNLLSGDFCLQHVDCMSGSCHANVCCAGDLCSSCSNDGTCHDCFLGLFCNTTALGSTIAGIAVVICAALVVVLVVLRRRGAARRNAAACSANGDVLLAESGNHEGTGRSRSHSRSGRTRSRAASRSKPKSRSRPLSPRSPRGRRRNELPLSHFSSKHFFTSYLPAAVGDNDTGASKADVIAALKKWVIDEKLLPVLVDPKEFDDMISKLFHTFDLDSSNSWTEQEISTAESKMGTLFEVLNRLANQHAVQGTADLSGTGPVVRSEKFEMFWEESRFQSDVPVEVFQKTLRKWLSHYRRVDVADMDFVSTRMTQFIDIDGSGTIEQTEYDMCMRNVGGLDGLVYISKRPTDQSTETSSAATKQTDIMRAISAVVPGLTNDSKVHEVLKDPAYMDKLNKWARNESPKTVTAIESTLGWLSPICDCISGAHGVVGIIGNAMDLYAQCQVNKQKAQKLGILLQTVQGPIDKLIEHFNGQVFHALSGSIPEKKRQQLQNDVDTVFGERGALILLQNGVTRAAVFLDEWAKMNESSLGKLRSMLTSKSIQSEFEEIGKEILMGQSSLQTALQTNAKLAMDGPSYSEEDWKRGIAQADQADMRDFARMLEDVKQGIATENSKTQDLLRDLLAKSAEDTKSYLQQFTIDVEKVVEAQLAKVTDALAGVDLLQIPRNKILFDRHENLINKGSYGSVYMGKLNRVTVAIKQLDIHQPTSKQRKYMETEAKTMKMMATDPNVVRLFGVYFDAPEFLLVMEFLPYDLPNYLCDQVDGDKDWVNRVQLAADVALGMRSLHLAGILHHDLKGNNVLVSADGIGKLADFGLARTKTASTRTKTSVAGTLAWLAPEYLDDAVYSTKCDVYSYGIVLYEIATLGGQPFANITAEAMIVKQVKDGKRPMLPDSDDGYDTPDWYRKLMKRCWSQDFRDRPHFEEVVSVIEKNDIGESSLCLRRALKSGGSWLDGESFVGGHSPLVGDEVMIAAEAILSIESAENQDILPQSAIWIEENGLLTFQSGTWVPFVADLDTATLPPNCSNFSSTSANGPTSSISGSDSATFSTVDLMRSSFTPMDSLLLNDPSSLTVILVLCAASVLAIVFASFFIVRWRKKKQSKQVNDLVAMDPLPAAPTTIAEDSARSDTMPLSQHVAPDNLDRSDSLVSNDSEYHVLSLRTNLSQSTNIEESAPCDNKYSQIPSRRRRRFSSTTIRSFVIPSSELTKKGIIGQGHFGVVWKGIWSHSDVAIKEVKGVSEQARNDLISEAQHFARMRPHPNIVQFLGVCTDDGDSMKLIIEFCDGGSLVNALYKGEQSVKFTVSQLFSIAYGCGSGLAHLHKLRIIHRDIAARNVLLTGDYKAKLTDFGMARVQTVDEQGTATDVGPIRWMAPEQLTDRQVNFSCDVWSFGVLLYEIFARALPWDGLSNMEVAHAVCNGQRMVIPRDVPEKIANVMVQCWDADPKQRPSMVMLLHDLSGPARKRRHSGGRRSRKHSSSTLSGRTSLTSSAQTDTVGSRKSRSNSVKSRSNSVKSKGRPPVVFLENEYVEPPKPLP